MRIIIQLIFGLKVFFKKLNFRNYTKIVKFLWKRYVLGKFVPFSVVFSLTYKCQCSCVHCSVGDYEQKGKDLFVEEVISVLDYINMWGPVKVTFFGGEPLLHNDLILFVRYASRLGIKTSIDTNGILLNENTVLALKGAGIGNINVSIDSSCEQTHDMLRQKEGCFKSAVRGIEFCVKHEIPCLISTYASKRAIREDDLKKIVTLGKKLKVDGVKILFPILSGQWREADEEMLSPEEEKYVMAIVDPSFVYIEDALQMVTRKGIGCSALDKNLVYISPYGDIQPCPAIPITFGNIRDTNIDRIIMYMENHPFFSKYKSCEKCLMNEKRFREEYHLFKSGKELPLDVKIFQL